MYTVGGVFVKTTAVMCGLALRYNDRKKKVTRLFPEGAPVSVAIMDDFNEEFIQTNYDLDLR